CYPFELVGSTIARAVDELRIPTYPQLVDIRRPMPQPARLAADSAFLRASHDIAIEKPPRPMESGGRSSIGPMCCGLITAHREFLNAACQPSRGGILPPAAALPTVSCTPSPCRRILDVIRFPISLAMLLARSPFPVAGCAWLVRCKRPRFPGGAPGCVDSKLS